ncbi:hypothetical protein OF83DRAFT_1179120 [Amylostereum chailletii]|nr:hypothetical protein OF83DRAFT_1179120 [Amylostereum chailletii]
MARKTATPAPHLFGRQSGSLGFQPDDASSSRARHGPSTGNTPPGDSNNDTDTATSPGAEDARANSEMQHPDVVDENVVTFDGDFFGVDYEEDDFGWGEEDDAAAANLGPDEPIDRGSDAEDDDEGDWGDEDEELAEASILAPEEPPPPDSLDLVGIEPMSEDEVAEEVDGAHQGDMEFLWKEPKFVRQFGGLAGAPTSISDTQPGDAGNTLDHANNKNSFETYEASFNNGESTDNNPYYTFPTKMDWELARWAKLRGSGSTAFIELLDIDELADKLNLAYQNSKQLNTLVDALPSRPMFHRHEVTVDGESYDVYLRDILECVRALYSSPDFAGELIFVPERHYTDPEKTVHMYSDMHTGRWWWNVQSILEKRKPGVTVVPIIISSDKTQLTLFRNRSTYPVYLTIGNIHKETRRKPNRHAQILLGYLPVTRLSHIKSDVVCRRALSNLFHACMRKAVAPLKAVGLEGTDMVSGDGVVHQCHPIYAVFVGDYPEQVLVTGVKTMECPKGTLDHDEMGDNILCTKRDLDAILDALAKADDNDPVAYVEACQDAGIKPLYHPFWEDLPLTDIFKAITPDILHQLYQGMVKHIIAWVKSAYGGTVIDSPLQSLPPNHNLRHFSKRISHLSRVSGTEHQDICRVLLGVIVDLPLPGGASPVRLIRAVRALLDFVYLAQYPSHTDSIFIDLGIREHFNFPKMHALQHYFPSVKLFGTADNFDTSYTERLHIDFTKDVYRSTNKKDEYSQMTLWLQRREKIHQHTLFVAWCLQDRPAVICDRAPMQILNVAEQYNPPFRSVAAYYKLKFWHPDTLGRDNAPETLDVVHSRPAYRNTLGRVIPGRFDTALIDEAGHGRESGVQGYRVGQVVDCPSGFSSLSTPPASGSDSGVPVAETAYDIALSFHGYSTCDLLLKPGLHPQPLCIQIINAKVKPLAPVPAVPWVSPRTPTRKNERTPSEIATTISSSPRHIPDSEPDHLAGMADWEHDSSDVGTGVRRSDTASDHEVDAEDVLFPHRSPEPTVVTLSRRNSPLPQDPKHLKANLIPAL